MLLQILACFMSAASLFLALSTESTSVVIGYTTLTITAFAIGVGLTLSKEESPHKNRHPIRYP